MDKRTNTRNKGKKDKEIRKATNKINIQEKNKRDKLRNINNKINKNKYIKNGQTKKKRTEEGSIELII